MPYITPENRDSRQLRDVGRNIMNAGELNYAITTLILGYLDPNSSVESASYNSINGVIGVLECAKLELYRRLAAPYEDKKIKENGDVY